MGAILALHRDLVRAGGDLRIIATPQPILLAFRRARLTDVLCLYGSIESVLA